MRECVYLAIAFGLMVALIRFRVAVGYALVAGAGAVGLLFGTDWGRWPSGFGGSLVGLGMSFADAAIDTEGLQLLGLVLLITFLGHALRHVQSLARLIAVLRALLRDRRAAMAVEDWHGATARSKVTGS